MIETRNPLLSQFDKDPGRWRPYKYETNIDVPVQADEFGENTIQILNQPFILLRISHAVIGNTNDYHGTGLANDGQYFIEWQDDNSVYQSGPINAIAGYGTPDWPIPLPSPIAFAGNKTIKIKITNAYARTLTPEADTFKVQIVFHGIADWGTTRQET
jgi:hypothetical protein